MIENMKIEIVREKRKTMVLKLESPQKAVLKAPIRLSDKKIEEFLQSKRNWLQTNSAKMSENADFAKQFDLRKHVFLDGKKVCDCADLAIDFDKLSPEKQNAIIKKYYFSQFDVLKEMTQKLSEQTGLKYSVVEPVSSVRVWGTYNAKGVVKLNFKLLCLPRQLAFYVICHELCHSKHMNHKPAFWKDVEMICPNHKLLRQELHKYAFLLKDKF